MPKKIHILDEQLMATQVYVTCAGLNLSSDQLALLAQILHPDEQQRAARFHFEKDRRYYIAGRGLLRRLLAEHLQVEASQLQFRYNAYGKPELAPPFDQTNLCFNLAHSGDWALYAITTQRRVGVDIERIRPEIEHEDLAKHVFSLHEQRTLQHLPPNQRIEAFFNGWSRKEAYIKAQGMGLSLPLDQFTVSISPTEPARLLSTEHAPEQVHLWSLQALPTVPGYAAALVVEGHDWQLCWRDVKVTEDRMTR